MHLQIISPVNPKELINSNVASYRLRLSYVYNAAIELGFNVSCGLKINKNADIIYVGKITKDMKQSLSLEINKLKKSKAHVLIDYTDDLLSSKKDLERRKIYEDLMSLNSVVIVPIEGLGNKIKEKGKIVFVIPDGIDNFPSINPFNKNNKQVNILWNGHSSNINSLIRIITTNLLGYSYNLHLVSNSASFEIFTKIQFTVSLKCTPFAHLWSINNLQNIAKKCDFAILPTDKLWASANRLITNFRLGLPVIAETIDSYKPFLNYYCEFKKNKIDNMFKSSTSYHNLVSLAQKKITEEFNEKKLNNLWKSVLKKK